MSQSVRRIAWGVVLVTTVACRTVGPNYQKPDAPTAAHWETPSPWRPSDPKDAIPKGEW